jgi:membrane-bound lytic murein transglycosylase B
MKIFLFTTGLLFYNVGVMAEYISQEQFIADMAIRHNFDSNYLMLLLDQAEVKQNIIRLMTPRRPRSGGSSSGRTSSPWYKYRRRFLTEAHIDGGVSFWQRNAQALKRAEATYGVPSEFVVAIIGVETHYGRNMGSFRVIDAMVTLSFHYLRRADFFREELENFLLLAREEGFDPLMLTGSYAGAMGLGQFMPSSFRRFAVDFDGDGRRDIWENEVDAIGSVANYFQQHGWQAGQTVIEATQIQFDLVDYLLALEFKPIYTLQQLKATGLLYHGEEADNTLAMFLDLETEQGTAYWLGFNNYYVITRYNNSKHYAMAVYQLAQAIADRYYALFP